MELVWRNVTLYLWLCGLDQVGVEELSCSGKVWEILEALGAVVVEREGWALFPWSSCYHGPAL